MSWPVAVGKIFFSDWKLEAIIQINQKGHQQTVLRKGIEYLRDITVYDEEIQQKPCMCMYINSYSQFMHVFNQISSQYCPNSSKYNMISFCLHNKKQK